MSAQLMIVISFFVYEIDSLELYKFIRKASFNVLFKISG